jgi:hypothetical protein
MEYPVQQTGAGAAISGIVFSMNLSGITGITPRVIKKALPARPE